MLKDLYFYPLAGLVIFGMISYALSFGRYEPFMASEIWQEGFTFEGENLRHLTAQPGTQSQWMLPVDGEPAYARLSSTTARDNLDPGPGVFAPIGPVYEQAFAGHLLRMTITARASERQPLKSFDMAYFSDGSGDTGWLRRDLTDEWQDYSFELQLGPLIREPSLDYFSIWPGTSGRALHMDVARMHIEVLDDFSIGAER